MVAGLNPDLGQPTTSKLAVNPAVNGHFFRIKEGYGSEMLCTDSNSHCPYGH